MSEAKRICDIKSPKDGNVAESKEKSAKESSADSVSNELPTASINLFSGEKNIKSLDAKIPIAGLYFDFLSFATVHKFKELNTKVYLSLTGGYMQQTKATKKDIVHAETQTLISSREEEATTEIPIFDNVTYNHDSPIVSGPPNYNSSYQAVVCIFSNSSDSSECYQYDIINEETSHSDPNPIKQPSVASSQEARCVFSSSSDSSECYEWQTVDENVFPDPSLINNAPSTGSNEIAVCVFINSSNSNCYHWNVYDEKIEYTAPNPANSPSTNSDEEAICVYEDRNNSSKCYDYIRVTEQSTYSAPSTVSVPSTNSDEIAVCVFENSSGSECYAYQKANQPSLYSTPYPTNLDPTVGGDNNYGVWVLTCSFGGDDDVNSIENCYTWYRAYLETTTNICNYHSTGYSSHDPVSTRRYCFEIAAVPDSTKYNFVCIGESNGQCIRYYLVNTKRESCSSSQKTISSGGNDYCLDTYTPAPIYFEKYDYICVDGSNFYCYKWEYRYSRTIECSSNQHTKNIRGEDYCLDTRSRPNTTQGSTSCEEGSTNNCYIWEFSKYNDQLCNNDQHEETLSNGRTYCLEDFDLDTVNNNNETYWDTRCESGSTRNNDCLRWEYLSTKTASRAVNTLKRYSIGSIVLSLFRSWSNTLKRLLLNRNQNPLNSRF